MSLPSPRYNDERSLIFTYFEAIYRDVKSNLFAARSRLFDGTASEMLSKYWHGGAADFSTSLSRHEAGGNKWAIIFISYQK